MAGRRERNKAERRARILRATFDLVAQKGFDETTTREIAERAGVAVGTVFLYAQDKMDLCLLSMHDELDKLSDLALENDEASRPLVERLEVFFRPRFAFWARYPKLSRAAAREMARVYAPDDSNKERERGEWRRAHAMNSLHEIIRSSAAKGELGPDVDIKALTRIIYDIYLIELRFWLATEPPDVEEGLRHYLYLVGVVLSGHAARAPSSAGQTPRSWALSRA